jgi:uncharacterized protein (TIGR02145 family)
MFNKIYQKFIIFISILVLVFFIFQLPGCKNDCGTNETSELNLLIVSPNIASIGDTITLEGTGLGSSRKTNFLAINSLKVDQYIKWTSTEIILKVPIGAKSGKIWVAVNGKKSNELDIYIKGTGADTIKKNGQVWLQDNLDVVTYQNGDTIPEVKDSIAWANLTTGAWCYYNNDPANGKIFGKLYNWYALNDPRGIAPNGWHVSTDSEWKELEMSLGMTFLQAESFGNRGNTEGGKLKSQGTIEAGTGYWNSPNTGATDEIGFTALPGGYRDDTGKFSKDGFSGVWWTNTQYDSDNGITRHLSSTTSDIFRSYRNKKFAFSIRFISDK